MKLRDNKGSITVFVLVGLLFMSAFLLLSYGSNVNKSKTAKEMFQMISDIYSYNDGDENAYMRAYTALRKQNAQEITSSNEGKEDTSTLELTKTFYGPINNYTIYGNSVQDTATYGTPSPTNPVEIQSVGDLVTDTTDENYGKYKIPVKVSGKNLVNIPDLTSTTAETNITCNLTVPFVISCQGEYPTSIRNNSDVETSIWRLKITYLDGTMQYVVDNTLRGGNISKFNASTENPVVKITYRGIYIKEGIYSKIQIEKGTVATEYVPYVEPQTVNIYLDEPLRKVGDVADYIDFSTGKVVRKVDKIEFTGEESWYQFGANVALGSWCNKIDAEKSSGQVYGYKSNIALESKNGASETTNDNTFSTHNLSNVNWIVYNINYDVEDWKQFLSDKYKNNNPVKALFQLATPREEETVELSELTVYEDYTNIEVLTETPPSKIEVTYDGYTFEK